MPFVPVGGLFFFALGAIAEFFDGARRHLGRARQVGFDDFRACLDFVAGHRGDVLDLGCFLRESDD